MHDEDKEVVAKVVPIATSFDLRAVAAPAVAVEVGFATLFTAIIQPFISLLDLSLPYLSDSPPPSFSALILHRTSLNVLLTWFADIPWK